MNLYRSLVAAFAVYVGLSCNAIAQSPKPAPSKAPKICVLAFYSKKAMESIPAAQIRYQFAKQGIATAKKPVDKGGLGFDVEHSGMVNVDKAAGLEQFRAFLATWPDPNAPPSEAQKKAEADADAQADIHAKAFQGLLDGGYLIYVIIDVSGQKLFKSDPWPVYNKGLAVDQIVFLRDKTVPPIQVAEAKPAQPPPSTQPASDGGETILAGGPHAPEPPPPGSEKK